MKFQIEGKLKKSKESLKKKEINKMSQKFKRLKQTKKQRPKYLRRTRKQRGRKETAKQRSEQTPAHLAP